MAKGKLDDNLLMEIIYFLKFNEKRKLVAELVTMDSKYSCQCATDKHHVTK